MVLLVGLLLFFKSVDALAHTAYEGGTYSENIYEDDVKENLSIWESVNEALDFENESIPPHALAVVTPNPATFIYPTVTSGWAYNSLAFQNLSFLNESIFAATNVSISIVPTGETEIVAFEYFASGLGVGPGGGVFNATTSIMPNGGHSHVRLRPAHESIAGTHTNLLVLEGDHGFRIEVPLTVTIEQHPSGNVNPNQNPFVFPELEYGYHLADTSAMLTGPRHINFTSNPAMFNVTPDRIRFAGGSDSPFTITRFLQTGTTGGNPTTTIGANTNVMIRPAAGLSIGYHEDVLIVEGDGNTRIEVPVSIRIVPRSGAFHFTQSRDVMDFGVRDVGYTAFAWATELSILVLNNGSTTHAITGLDGSDFVFESQLNGELPAFEFEGSGFRSGSSTSTASNPFRSYIPPNGTNGQLRIRPRHGLPAGIYTDTLYIRGEHGFEASVNLTFEVNMPEANVTVSPTSWEFPAEYVGYTFNGHGNAVRGWQEFIFTNNTPTNQPATITFEKGLASPFRVQRGFTNNSLQNPGGSSTVRPYLSASNPQDSGLRIFPHNYLPPGTYTDVLMISNDFGLDIRIPLSFTVLPMPEDHNDQVLVSPGRSFQFAPRQYGASIHDINNNTRWTEFRIFNHSGVAIPGVSARFESGDDSPFIFNRQLGNGTGTGLTGGAVNIANSGVAGTTVGANVRVWPREGLPVGVHRDVLILENATGFRKEIHLHFEVTALDVSLSEASFTWPTRHVRYPLSTAMTNVNQFDSNAITGIAEVLLTNHGDAPLRLPALGNNNLTRGFFDSVTLADGDIDVAWMNMQRAPTAQSLIAPDASTTAVTTVQPGATVSLRFHPLPNQPPGVYHDVFRLHDFYGNHLGDIEFNFEVIDWELGAPENIVFDSRQVGYSINQGSSTSTTAHGTDAHVFTLENLRQRGNLEDVPSIASGFLEKGADSPFVTHQGSATGTGTNGRGVIPLDVSRNFWVRPREGLAPGLYTDHFILTNTRGPLADPLVKIPLSISIDEPDLTVRENGVEINPADGVIFSDRMPGYTLDEHNNDDYIRLSFENLGSNPFNQLTATILQPDLSGPSADFSIMTGINSGDGDGTNVTILPVDGMVNLRIWQRLDLPIGTHEAVLRLGNDLGFEVLVPLSFTVEDFDTEFFDVYFEPRLEDFVEEIQIAEFTLRNNSTTPAFIIDAVLEQGNDSPFELIGVTPGTIIGDDIMAFDVTTRPNLETGIHVDYIIITGNFGFERRVRVEFEILPVYHDLTFHLQGGEATFDLVQPVRLNQTAVRPPVNPTFIGYYFVDWYTEETNGEPFDFSTLFTRALGGVDVYARWHPSYHNISFVLNDGFGEFPDQVIRDGEMIQAPTAEPTPPIGYEFTGWFTAQSGGTPFDFDDPMIRLMPSQIDVHARWRPLYHDITFHLHGGTGEFPLTSIRDGRRIIEPEAPTPPTGQQFRGWYSDETSDHPFDFNLPIRGNSEIHARWMPNDAVIITFDPTIGSIAGYDGQVTRITPYASAIGIDNMPQNPIPPLGYEFVGWFSRLDGTIFDAQTVVSTNTVVYARWEAIEETTPTIPTDSTEPEETTSPQETNTDPEETTSGPLETEPLETTNPTESTDPTEPTSESGGNTSPTITEPTNSISQTDPTDSGLGSGPNHWLPQTGVYLFNLLLVGTIFVTISTLILASRKRASKE